VTTLGKRIAPLASIRLSAYQTSEYYSVSKRNLSGLLFDNKSAARDWRAYPSGRRDTKERGSVEWIVQTTHFASTCLASLERSTEDWLKVIADLEGERVWEKIPPEKPYGSREAFFIGEFGRPEPELTAAKEKQQLAQAKHAGPGRGHKTDSNTIRFGRDAAYIRARLERDGKTDLLARVEQGIIRTVRINGLRHHCTDIRKIPTSTRAAKSEKPRQRPQRP
jgi:hypothetical protein